MTTNLHDHRPADRPDPPDRKPEASGGDADFDEFDGVVGVLETNGDVAGDGPAGGDQDSDVVEVGESGWEVVPPVGDISDDGYEV
jgi:hypothetical protein